MAAPDAKRINARAAKDKAFLKRALKNPGLRAKLDPKYLSKPQAAARALNTRLNAPIAPGSSTTERDLAHEAQAATTVRYGPQDRDLAQQLGIAQQVERDTGGLYDQYRAALQEHAARVQGYQAGAAQQLQQAQAGITGLGQAQAAQLQQQADAGAAQQGVAQAGQIGDLANQALAVRQAQMGSYGAQQAAQGAAMNAYADTQANVVAPGQKLTALAQARGRTQDVRKRVSDLATEKGAFNQQFRDTRRQDEFKNQLAVQTLGANIAQDQAQAANAATKITQTSPEGKAAATTATEEAKNAAKLGISVHQYRLLGPTERGKRLRALKATKAGSASDTRYSSGPFAGMLKSAVNALTPDAAQKLVDKYQSKSGAAANPKTVSAKAFRQQYGVDLQTTGQHNSARDNVSAAQRALKLVGTKDKNGKVITTQAIVDAMASGGVKGIPKTSPLWVRAALDITRYGHITAATAARMHKAGYSVGTLGFKTGSAKRPDRTRNPQGPRTGPGASVPGVGGGR